ncbi:MULTISPECIES: hypothetical protein [unclassified Alteromonas]|nr:MULTISPECIES: hypothetical protein [unclassified Alteromonas]MEC8233068.1 hypothetical protein [Pseudomonadota bacterium]WDT86363.1 hypothetical protein OZ660_01035 [Alteromonas sp. 009811495]
MKNLPSLCQPVSLYGSHKEHETVVIGVGIPIGIVIGIYLR